MVKSLTIKGGTVNDYQIDEPTFIDPNIDGNKDDDSFVLNLAAALDYAITQNQHQ
jgi:hypothetical protein